MAAIPIKLNNRVIYVQKSIGAPVFGASTVLVDDTWDFVGMWLRRHSTKESVFYWNQARDFYEATQSLAKTAKPLTAYYSALNATKALLLAHRIPHSPYHGVTGKALPGKTSLSNEQVGMRANGVFGALSDYFSEPRPDTGFISLKDILYNLTYLHRAYTVTYTSEPELFIPIDNPHFVRKAQASESWFCCEIAGRRFTRPATLNTLDGFENDPYYNTKKTVVRMKKRFRWKHGGSKHDNIARLTTYHKRVRKHLFYIAGSTRLWYIKRNSDPTGFINRSSSTLTFAALHRISEIARYRPDSLQKHFECRHNWLLSEFINGSLTQYIDEISSEITGADFMPTRIRT
ncbi:YaaC family protein [Actomonas aquatica]|uniref:YaaC family protein n=1 Tax=Actomonas aquatica TaxID=2866162 RepID=A0ABZ1C3M5_9BACT|nr:YaaC family protein [Opitutus sp. WL0086]WRQ85967.1 YaaC family protein [Opitutus sp. WL0086]